MHDETKAKELLELSLSDRGEGESRLTNDEAEELARAVFGRRDGKTYHWLAELHAAMNQLRGRVSSNLLAAREFAPEHYETFLEAAWMAGFPLHPDDIAWIARRRLEWLAENDEGY